MNLPANRTCRLTNVSLWACLQMCSNQQDNFLEEGVTYTVGARGGGYAAAPQSCGACHLIGCGHIKRPATELQAMATQAIIIET
jgi:hypothetical protein